MSLEPSLFRSVLALKGKIAGDSVAVTAPAVGFSLLSPRARVIMGKRRSPLGDQG